MATGVTHAERTNQHPSRHRFQTRCRQASTRSRPSRANRGAHAEDRRHGSRLPGLRSVGGPGESPSACRPGRLFGLPRAVWDVTSLPWTRRGRSSSSRRPAVTDTRMTAVSYAPGIGHQSPVAFRLRAHGLGYSCCISPGWVLLGMRSA